MLVQPGLACYSAALIRWLCLLGPRVQATSRALHIGSWRCASTALPMPGTSCLPDCGSCLWQSESWLSRAWGLLSAGQCCPWPQLHCMFHDVLQGEGEQLHLWSLCLTANSSGQAAACPAPQVACPAPPCNLHSTLDGLWSLALAQRKVCTMMAPQLP